MEAGIYELTNSQRLYFGLLPVAEHWDRVVLSDVITVYFDHDKIVKLLDYTHGFFEYDTDIQTLHRQIILPKTTRGKQQKLTVPRLLKIKPSGIAFTGSFEGGGIHVYDNRRNLFFIQSYSEEGNIRSYKDIENWITHYIQKLPNNYFDWLHEQVSQKRLAAKVKEGDVIAFAIGHGEYGFARVLVDVFAIRKDRGLYLSPQLMEVHPRSLIVMPYAYYDTVLNIDIDILCNKRTLPLICIFDLEVYRGQMPIIGHKPLSDEEKRISIPWLPTCVTINYSKTYITAAMKNERVI